MRERASPHERVVFYREKVGVRERVQERKRERERERERERDPAREGVRLGERERDRCRERGGRESLSFLFLYFFLFCINFIYKKSFFNDFNF